ncbi:MAG: tetratricopeptide repeat protein [Verrucomicrobiales bacterium]|nr:tetratricopeptide repeat protein [Verrucomicrobiales bacterium]
MTGLQDQYDDAMYDFSRGDYAGAVAKLEAILRADPAHFDAQLSLGMAYARLGDHARAIAEGHKAEKLRPQDQLVHTNLSLFYVKAGDKGRAEHHGVQARIASWRGNLAPPDRTRSSPEALPQAAPAPPRPSVPEEFPDMPWKKKPTTPVQSSPPPDPPNP